MIMVLIGEKGEGCGVDGLNKGSQSDTLSTGVGLLNIYDTTKKIDEFVEQQAGGSMNCIFPCSTFFVAKKYKYRGQILDTRQPHFHMETTKLLQTKQAHPLTSQAIVLLYSPNGTRILVGLV